MLQGNSAHNIENMVLLPVKARLELVAEYCENRLRELRRKNEKRSWLAKLELARRNPRRSGHVQKTTRKSARILPVKPKDLSPTFEWWGIRRLCGARRKVS